MLNDLHGELRNWGHWLNDDSRLGPATVHCGSYESRYLPEAGHVWDEDLEPSRATPNVADAEAMHVRVRKLDALEQYALAVLYGGYSAVFRYRRIGDSVMKKLLDNAEARLLQPFG